MAQGYETRFTVHGAVRQAGVPSPEPRPSSLEGMPLGYMTEAVVLTLYWPEEDTRAVAGKQTCLLADVRTIGLNPREFSKVRVLQPRHGIHDEDLWTPRPASVTTDGSALVTQPSGTSGTGSAPTRAEMMDGEHVLLAFLENSIAKPVILPISAPHPNAATPPLKSAGLVRRIRHNGTIVEWSNKGSWTLDATGAAKSALGNKAVEVSAAGDGGVITLKTKDGSGAQSSMMLNNQGGIKILGAGGEYIETIKSSGTVKISATKHEISATTMDVSATTLTTSGTSATIGHGLVALATAPREPVIKAATYNAQEAILLTAIGAYIKLIGDAMQALSADGALDTQNTKPKALLAGSAAATTLQNAITAFTELSATWTSLKVTTG